MLTTAGIPLLLTLLAAYTLGTRASEQELLITSTPDYHRNKESAPHTIEMPHDASWGFACRWSRRSTREAPILVIEIPGQSLRNCQFSTTSGPAVCTPSYVEFPSGGATRQVSNLTCSESTVDRLTLTCSINVQGFNSHHIGVWSCKNLTDLANSRNESVFLQYYKILPQSDLVLASWDPIGPKPTNGTPENATNRFECFTSAAVVPPARLTYLLGGVELTRDGSAKYPVEWLTDTVFTERPVGYQFNLSAANVTASFPRTTPSPSGGLKLNQRMLASSRILELRLQPDYNGLILQCVANQGLSNQHRAAEHSIVLHLDGKGGGATVGPRPQTCALLVLIIWWLAAAD